MFMITLNFIIGSPSEVAGLRQGHIVTSVNGVNVLEADHDEIIRLVQQGL